MERLKSFASEALKIALAMIGFMVCIIPLVVLYVYAQFKRLSLDNKAGISRKIAMIATKPYIYLGGQTNKVFLKVACFYAVFGLAFSIVLCIFMGRFSFIFILLVPAVVAAVSVFAFFLIMLAAKVLSVPAAVVLSAYGLADMHDVLDKVGVELIQLTEEEEQKRNAEWDARNRARQEQSKAYKAYLGARNRYQSASAKYRSYMSQGLTEDAMRFKAEMDMAQTDMLRSGYKE